MPVKLPSCRFPPKIAVLREETTSSRLSLETKIDQFHLEEKKEEQEEPMIQVLDSEDELDRSSSVRTPRLIISWVDDSLEEEEEEEMALNRKKGLHKVFANRAKGLTPKDTSGSQSPLTLPPHPPSIVNLFAIANLKKKRKE